MTTHKHLAVVGRVDGDDEDSILFYHDVTVGEAEQAFREDLRQGKADDGVESPVEDDAIYINYVLTSEAPIHITRNYT